MRLLLDTHALLWTAQEPGRLSRKAHRLFQDVSNELFFSVVSIWEIGVKSALNRPDFRFDPRVLRAELLLRGFEELSVTGDHVLAVEQLPLLHRDPFDRLLLCQAMVGGLTLATNDAILSSYPVSVVQI
jgi:PIN domain nuclease of toxin-antitoxin system